jgi:hypothetical protein
MKIRLSIANDSGLAMAFESAGPVIRVGRDPDNELSLQGDASNAVSRQHARIEMTAEGATVADAGSSNGTLLNGKLLKERTPLRVGDNIQLGYTGATLTVSELDVAQLSNRSHGGVPRNVVIGSVAAVAVAAVVTIALLVLRKPRPPEEHAAAPVTPASISSAEPLRPPQSDVIPPPKPTGLDTDPKKPPAKPIATSSIENKPKAMLSDEIKEVGAYVALDHWVSVLLLRQGEANPWAVLRPEARVPTAVSLVSLPGYRSLVALDSGIDLTLWGNLPDFSFFPPVLESVAMLHLPAAGDDLDFTLDRGRVLIGNHKKSGGPAHMRVRFLREVWQVELPDASSEIAVELWTLPRAAPRSGAAPPPVACVGLFTKGKARVITSRQTFDLAERSRLSWVSQEPATVFRADNLPELPAWWTKQPDQSAPEVQKALRSLLDWSDQLGGSNTDPARRTAAGKAAEPVITTIKTQVEEVKDPDNQDVGVFFLAALDETEPLLDLLKDPVNANVRGATLFALQSWLSRGIQHAADLVNLLERRGDSKERAERIVRLLHFLPPEALEQKKTYEELIAYLDDDNRAVRNLAFWQLDQLGVGGWLPDEAKKIEYDPTWESEQRRPAIEQWKKLIADGKVPRTARR